MNLLLTIGPTVAISSVYPSGAALAAAPAAILPFAPGRFSTMKFWPRRALSDAVTNRMSVSVLVPAANGQSTVTGRAGHGSAASAGPASGQAAAAPKARIKSRRLVLVVIVVVPATKRRESGAAALLIPA